jgi:hypothetical protein
MPYQSVQALCVILTAILVVRSFQLFIRLFSANVRSVNEAQSASFRKTLTFWSANTSYKHRDWDENFEKHIKEWHKIESWVLFLFLLYPLSMFGYISLHYSKLFFIPTALTFGLIFKCLIEMFLPIRRDGPEFLKGPIQYLELVAYILITLASLYGAL